MTAFNGWLKLASSSCCMLDGFPLINITAQNQVSLYPVVKVLKSQLCECLFMLDFPEMEEV